MTRNPAIAALNSSPTVLAAVQRRVGVAAFQSAMARGFADIERRRVAREDAQKARRAASRQAMADEDAEFAEMLAAGFELDELRDEYPGAYERHQNALWRASL